MRAASWRLAQALLPRRVASKVLHLAQLSKINWRSKCAPWQFQSRQFITLAYPASVFVEEKVEETPELKEKVQFPLSDYSDHYRFRDRGGEQRELFAQYSTAVNGKRMYVAVAETTSADITQVQDSENELVPIILHSSRKETFRVLVKAPK